MNYYLLSEDNQQIGPFSESDLRTRLASQSLSDTDWVWQEGWVDWRPIGTVIKSDFGHSEEDSSITSIPGSPQTSSADESIESWADLLKPYAIYRIHFLVIGAIAIIGLIALVSRNALPSEGLARRDFLKQVAQNTNNQMQVLSFRKINGSKAEFFGMPLYILTCEAEVVFAEDCVWLRGMLGNDLPGSTRPIRKPATEGPTLEEYLDGMSNLMSDMLQGQPNIKRKGDRVKMRLEIAYQKTERGWVRAMP